MVAVADASDPARTHATGGVVDVLRHKPEDELTVIADGSVASAVDRLAIFADERVPMFSQHDLRRGRRR
jgi:hypothetical protein